MWQSRRRALCYHDRKTLQLLTQFPGEHPAAVQISGQFTEMQRQNLARYIEENLAIGKEQQTWTNE